MVVQATARLIGLAVAGGHSRRMGRDKAWLPWQKGTLLDHAVARLRACTPEVWILAGEHRYGLAGVAEAPDDTPGLGPLGGLVTGLRLAGGGAALLLAVDIPLAPPELLRRLAARLGEADAVVPVGPDGPQPLCAAYGPACLSAARRRLAAGERRMTAFWPDVRVREVRDAELRELGDPAVMFANVNTPEDYERWADRSG